MQNAEFRMKNAEFRMKNDNNFGVYYFLDFAVLIDETKIAIN
jgi:hypothetical protein